MANRTAYTQVVQAKRKYSALEIIGNIVIWAAPIAMMLFIVAWNWNKLWQQNLSFHLELWMTPILLITCFIYIKWGRRKIHEKYVADNARAEKHAPILVLFNALINLAPFVIGIMVLDLLNALGEPTRVFLIALLIVEAVGRLLLFIDSFVEEEYK